MKKMLITLVLLTVSILNIYSQKPQENTTYSDNYLDKFEGNWLWVSGSDTVKLCLRKKMVKIPHLNNSYWDWLLGTHKYINNGLEIENTMNQLDSLQYYTNTNRIGSLHLYRIDNQDTANAEGTLFDVSKSKGNQIDLTYLGGNPVQIRMKLSLKGSQASFPGKPYIDGITLPTDIILFKQ